MTELNHGLIDVKKDYILQRMYRAMDFSCGESIDGDNETCCDSKAADCGVERPMFHPTLVEGVMLATKLSSASYHFLLMCHLKRWGCTMRCGVKAQSLLCKLIA